MLWWACPLCFFARHPYTPLLCVCINVLCYGWMCPRELFRIPPKTYICWCLKYQRTHMLIKQLTLQESTQQCTADTRDNPGSLPGPRPIAPTHEISRKGKTLVALGWLCVTKSSKRTCDVKSKSAAFTRLCAIYHNHMYLS